MKKNLFLAAILCIGLTALFNSCVKDTFTEQDAYNEQRKNAQQQDSIAKSQMELEAQLAMEQALLLDSLKNVGGVINYSVGVVVASESSWLKGWESGKGEKGLDGAVVTIAQHGRTFTATTDASGIASFKDLRMGTANVNVRKAGVTTVDYVVEFPPVSYEDYVYYYHEYDMDGDYEEEEEESWTQHIVEMVRHAATMVPVFSLTDNLSTIKGVATAELDLTNNAPEPVAGVNVKGIIDVDNSAFYNTYLYNPYPTKSKPYTWFDFYGYVKQIAFGSTISTATTGADGSFTLSVPSTPQGLPIEVIFDEFAANQTLLLPTLGGLPVWGPQTVRTMFGPNVGTASTIYGLGVVADKVQSAYVTFSDPTGNAAPQPTEKASATAVLTSSGIVSVNITNPGTGYTQAPLVRIAKGNAYNSVQAEGTATISGGQVTGVSITSAGSGYTPVDNPTVSFIESIPVVADFVPEFTYSVMDITYSGGSGYSQTPPNVNIIGAGTGATAHAVMGADIKLIDITNMGSGYTQAPTVLISDNFRAYDKSYANMTISNPLFSIIYNGNNTTLWPASPAPTVTVNGDGAGATASVTLSTTGKVTGVTIGAGGSGYTSAPVVTFTGGGGFGAAGYATLGTGAVTGVVITDPGQGYTSAPTVAFSGGAGTGATGTATIGFPVTSISMTAAGNGYSSISSIPVTNGTLTVDYSTNCTVKYNMGVRSVTLVNIAGNYFSGVPTVTFVPKDGNGTGAAATAAVNWAITDIVVDNQGSGYKYRREITTVKIDPPAGVGTQATGTAVLGNGKLASVGLSSQGEGYTAVPNVYLNVTSGSLPIKQAELSATISNGHVTGLSITDPGEGYLLASDTSNFYDIVISTYNSSAAATAHANPESGKIAYIQINNPGAGYAVVPTVEITNISTPSTPPNNNNYQGNANGFGSGATATAVVVDGRVTAITVTNAGAGYYYVPDVNVNVTSAVMKAVGLCDVSADGRITDVVFPSLPFITKGYGYDSAPTITFTPSVAGKGTGAIGVAVIKDGHVDDVIMTNEGSGYIGMNRATGFTVTTDPWSITVTAGKTYMKDLYFGTGRRTVD